MKKTISIITIIIAIVLTIFCFSLYRSITNSPELQVKSTASTYWDSVKFKDYAAQYEMLSPEDKALISKEKFIESGKEDVFTIKDVKIDDVKVAGDSATVRITIYADTGEFPGTTELVNEGGHWYKKLSDQNKEALGITE